MSLTAKELSQRYNQQYLDFDCIEGLQILARGMNDHPLVVNVGAGFGTSGLALLESRPDIRVITVDAHDEVTPIGGLASERAVMAEAGFLGNDRFEQIHSMSIPAGEDWNRGPLDMVFVDGSHSYEACKGDALAWLPHIRRRGVIAFHDYWERYDYEVIRAVDEVMAPYEEILSVSCLRAYRIP
jgi:predicted O-methyltransferase YrrM